MGELVSRIFPSCSLIGRVRCKRSLLKTNFVYNSHADIWATEYNEKVFVTEVVILVLLHPLFRE